ncbi:ABC-F family ATP-binding cassette domain-containing protein [Natroniella sulfidigena]|uniref:ABC-F family ATP-binding cassette domain-containing protein n=1 Tax=Natroniella sulfidigena TaxID=723921 RepID=UPI00200B7FFA|nr:ABC-F family ATP-binding cassette domain-containing protein [Natroniella sulfidigena]MCK8815794.1 ABC-F family ATP-binding cassette domain-containing protein [Natroniella sulfidigena]
MALLQLKQATKVYPEKLIFDDVSLQIQKRDRIGLIGANGTGKSTLMKVLIGQEFLDQGEIMTANNLEVGYLAQDFGLDLDNKLYDELLGVYQDLFELEEQLNQLEAKMSQVEGNALEQVMNKYSRLREEYERKEGYQYQSQIKGVLRGLGFAEDDWSRNLDSFSGGEKTRAALAKLLLQQPDLLLLDEPTNHLDLAAKEWLEDYLQDYEGAVVVIAHDRYFLDQVVNRIWELEAGRFEQYKGNYSFYLEEKPRRLLTWQREYEEQQEKIAKMEAYIRKNKAGVDAKQARGRQKQLDRMVRIPPPPKLERPKIEFKLETTSGEEVLKVEGLKKSFASEVLFERIDFRIYRGEKIALVGPNGSGKSTLFRLLLEDIKPEEGQIKWGSKVKVGYYRQEHEDLTLENNLIEELQKVKGVTTSQARKVLARFLFKEDDVFKEVEMLSGGEKARLSLAKLSIQDFNLLLLDEPTNHLDIDAKELLEEALADYPGTILVISHDRYFLDRLVDKIFSLEDGRLIEYLGDYSDYRAELKKQKCLERELKKERRKQEEGRKVTRKQDEVDLERLEEKIVELEERVEELEVKLGSEDIYDDPEGVADLTEEYKEIQRELEKYYQRWEEAI